MPGPQLVCVYPFKVVLRGISPMIGWRLLLRSDQSIAHLPYAIPIAMGGSDSSIGFTFTARITASRTRAALPSPTTSTRSISPISHSSFASVFSTNTICTSGPSH